MVGVIEPLWTAEDVSMFLGVPVSIRYQWRYRRQGPRARKVGRHLRYDPANVQDWLDRGGRAMSVVRRPNGKWRARYRDVSGKEHARHFDRKVDAGRWLASVKTALARGEWIDPTLARVTFGEWAARWLDNQVQLKPSTRQRYASLLRMQVQPVWERVPLSAVTHADVGEWVRRMSQAGLAASTVRQAHRVLSLLLALAVQDGRLSRNVAAGVRLPRVGRAEKVFLTHAQVGELAAAAEPHGLIVRVLAYTGCGGAS